MKNAENVYWQIDNRIKQICLMDEAEILPINKAWQKYNWVKKYFKQKPKQGYFIWIKKQSKKTFSTCVSIANKNTKQKLENLLVLEKGVKAKIEGNCNSLKKDLSGIHQATGKIVLKENATLKYNHTHSWKEKDIVETNYDFFLEKNSKLNYTYKSFSSPQKLRIKTTLNIFENATAKVVLMADCEHGETNIKETLSLKEKGSSGIIKLRLVGRNNSKISACSKVLAQAEGKGHLDCQGILLDNNSSISLTPELLCENKKAQITHEASIGKISQEELTYLRMRGLTEKQAINLIISGFLQ